MERTLSYYENNAKYLSQRYESANVDNIHVLLKNTFSRNISLLEIGCGSGRDASFMYENGYDVFAIDGSKEMISEAKKYHPEMLDRLQVMKIPDQFYFESSSFDGIYSIATLMHLEKDVINSTFERISKILKPGGKFLFSVSIERDDLNDQGIDYKGRHFATITELEWIALCEKYGMQLEHSEVMCDGLDRDGIIWLTTIVSKYNKP